MLRKIYNQGFLLSREMWKHALPTLFLLKLNDNDKKSLDTHTLRERYGGEGDEDGEREKEKEEEKKEEGEKRGVEGERGQERGAGRFGRPEG